MKSKYLSAAAALLCVAGLAACGGKGNGSIALVVQVVGLDRGGLVLQNNGGDDLTISAAGSASYSFATLMAPDSQFNVTLKTVPANVTCKLANNTGKINYYTYNQTVVNCAADPYTLGGTIRSVAADGTGAEPLSADGLVLANGAQTLAVARGASTWQFATPIGNQNVYGVTVLTQPAGQQCEVSMGTGTMPARNVVDVAVTCKKPQ
ncbi:MULTISPECIES: hypothetical protein [unclassified Duganella]|uniref:hypothetical protein n=1 Tax=unclassified Duganella TaxID=2636909 RepID=UPI0006FFAE64|nr:MULTISPECIES: hypothetical protein [unclassified Duganella]KQV47716.1 hypothetical protein ASD07_12385 [Duganella sp. Root336D2]KRB81996.1 hypothetical protein ASE26_13890 [Duganella sp. Root198D2]